MLNKVLTFRIKTFCGGRTQGNYSGVSWLFFLQETPEIDSEG
jgi:hypothetical protein